MTADRSPMTYRDVKDLPVRVVAAASLAWARMEGRSCA